MIGIFIALISGALMSVQGVFNTEVTKASSVWVSASWVHQRKKARKEKPQRQRILRRKDISTGLLRFRI